ncbi:MAG TPA: hypothetical protein VNT22_10825 [Baekduia sp.]|nr:hypothetical protein [Baekduia sp.]
MDVFYYDFTSPAAYLIAEEMVQAEWVPVRANAFDQPPPTLDGFAERIAATHLQPFKAPSPFPFESELVLRAATYAMTIGKVVAFTLAAFRQAYAGGRPLDDPDNIVIAGAACEIHPRALLQAMEREPIAARLDESTTLARERVATVPSIWTPDR